MSLTAIRRELRGLADADKAAFVQRYFKTGPGEYGEGDKFLGIKVPELRRVARAYRDLTLADLGALVRSKWHEERAVALLILADRYRRASVWERRIAIISTRRWIKQGDFGPALEIAHMLLGDSHDLIHKASGWMVREIADRDRAAAEAFLRRHLREMPRTMLRYAIEKFPEELRQRYLRGTV